MQSNKKIPGFFNNIHFPFLVFTISVLVITILPSLIQDGMFIDGIQYAAISKNLANGLGTFWFPYLSENWNLMGSPYFLEHPPLVYAIQSIFFRIFGDGLYTERIYCFITAIVSALLIANIWKITTMNNREIQKLFWLPVLFWISMPIATRSYQMNVQENTMLIFILASVYCVLKGVKSNKYSFLYMASAGILIFFSSLCKGVPGLFPMVTVFMYWLTGGKIRFPQMIKHSLVLLFIPVLIYLFVLLNSNAYESLSFYFSARLLERVQNDPVVNSHFHILFRLIIDLLPAIIISAVVYFANRKLAILIGDGDTDNSADFENSTNSTSSTNSDITKGHRAYIIFFILIGIAGSLPLAFTLVQRDFYLAPSLPFYAISIALIISPYVRELMNMLPLDSRMFRIFRLSSISLLMGGLIFTGLMIGHSERDTDLLHDIYIMGEQIGENNRVSMESSQGNTWSFELYMIRYFNISFGSSLQDSKYVIRRIDDLTSGADQVLEESCELIPLDTKVYDLYRKEN